MRDSAVAEEIEDAPGAMRVELGERIIEQDERSAASATKRSSLEQTKRNGCGALLSRRAKCAQRMAAERELEIVAMRAGVRQSATQIRRAVRRERVSEQCDELRY